MNPILCEIKNAEDDSLDGLIAYIDIHTLIVCAKNDPEFLANMVERIGQDDDGLLDIITLYAQSGRIFCADKKYEPKPYQYIRDYNGKIRLIAKQYPPSIQKGEKRNTADFKAYDRKLDNSVSRARKVIFELAECNDWEYFVTFTINPRYYSRYDLKTFMKAFRKWLSNYSARKTDGKKIEYVLVAEWGKKFAWHLHGFMTGIPLEHLSQFQEEKQPRLCQNGYLNWKAYENKFGHCAISTPIGCKKKVAAYITKQLRKSGMTRERPLHSQLYYCVQGLKRSTEICRGYNLVNVNAYDYENEYVGIVDL